MFELVFSDVRFPEGDGIFLLKWVNRKGIEIPFLIMTEYAPISDAVRAIKLGGQRLFAKLSCSNASALLPNGRKNWRNRLLHRI